MNIDAAEQIVGNAVRSMYQMIMIINLQTYDSHFIDHNKELRNIPNNVTSFGSFCNGLYRNIHPEDREGVINFTDPDQFTKELADKVFTSFECRIRQADSRYYWSRIIFCNAAGVDTARMSENQFTQSARSCFAGDTGAEYECLFLIQDIHEWKMKELQEEAEQRALFKELQDKYSELFEENMRDEQTGCYNRKGMKYYIDMVLDEARQTGKYLFVCVADLNGLKHLNDTYGHAAGDEAIAAVSAELLKAAPKGSRIVRTGGDEFLLFTALDKDSSEPEKMNEKIDQGLEEYNKLHPNPFSIGASYGWILLPLKEGMTDLDEYIEIADAKMYEMKVLRDKYRRD